MIAGQWNVDLKMRFRIMITNQIFVSSESMHRASFQRLNEISNRVFHKHDYNFFFCSLKAAVVTVPGRAWQMHWEDEARLLDRQSSAMS